MSNRRRVHGAHRTAKPPTTEQLGCDCEVTPGVPCEQPQVGWIEFVDETGRTRTVGFCREHPDRLAEQVRDAGFTLLRAVVPDADAAGW